MADLRLELKGFDEIKRTLALLPERLQKNYLRGGVRAALAVLAKEARREAPVASGQLRRSIRTSTRAFYSGRVTGKVNVAGPRARHAHLVEFGTKPHRIIARTAKALAIGPGVLVKEVQHPGAKARPYMGSAVARKSGAAHDAFETYVHTRLMRFWATGK